MRVRRDVRRFMELSDRAEAGIDKAGIHTARRHLFLCIGPDCCVTREGERLWEVVKMRAKEVGLEAMRTKAGCFRICADGPWLVVYPEGIWYPQVTPERFERILQEHLVAGFPVQEWIAAKNCLLAN